MWILVLVLLQGGQVTQGKMVGMVSEQECKETAARYVEQFKAAPEVQVKFECWDVRK